MFIRSAPILPLAGVLLAFTSRTLAQSCLSYGIDFVNGGSYFINTLSNDSFTCVTQFSGRVKFMASCTNIRVLTSNPGCQNDTANVVLVDPSGDEYECTDIPLDPDYTSEMSTCPIEKDQMTSGEWGLIVISNNGNGDPIAYERDFYITAGPQATVTVCYLALIEHVMILMPLRPLRPCYSTTLPLQLLHQQPQTPSPAA